LAQAATIRTKLGIELPANELQAIIEIWKRRDVDGRASAVEIEKLLSADRNNPPSPHYLRAKANALDYMAKAA
jgi:hypothetical protein